MDCAHAAGRSQAAVFLDVQRDTAVGRCATHDADLTVGAAHRLAEVPTVGTRLSAAYQSSMLALLHRRFAARGEIYAAFIGDLVGSPERRAGIMAELKAGLSTKPARGAD